jgi:branched-chain amino acid transport system ATP-binding protein
MNENILKIKGLAVSYGSVGAISSMDIDVAAGQIVTIIGPNGAGKSTLLNAMMGVLPVPGQSSGAIRFMGEDVSEYAVSQRVELGMCLVPETRELFGPMSVQENLRLGAFSRRRSPGYRLEQSLDEVYQLFPRLKERRKQAAHTLSGGERQMLALGRALMAKPKLLMLDEPSLGLAPLIVRDIFRIVADLRALGVSILLVEQNARAALQIADYGYVLETGSVAMQGRASELAADKRVVETYLGVATPKTTDEPVAGFQEAN